MQTRRWLLSVCVMVVFGVSVQAQRPGGIGGLGNLTQAQPLLSREMEEKLKLDDTQKKQVAKLDKEYGTKQTETLKPIKDSVEKMTRDRDFGAARELMPQLREVRTKLDDLRKDYDGKVKDVLKDEQKKTYDELAKERTAQRPGGIRPGQPGLGARPGAAAKPGTVLPDNAVERLKLSDDQKKQLETLQKKVDEELNKLLTEDQKKQFEEMKKGPPAPGGRRPRTDTN